MVDQEKIVLIVDDSPSIRRQVSLILNKSGISVREAGSQFGMLNSVVQYGKRVDLIIMDLTLKSEHGFDLISNLKKSPKYNDIPILVLTENADIKNVISAKNLGVDGYMRKPIVVDELLGRVQALL